VIFFGEEKIRENQKEKKATNDFSLPNNSFFQTDRPSGNFLGRKGGCAIRAQIPYIIYSNVLCSFIFLFFFNKRKRMMLLKL